MFFFGRRSEVKEMPKVTYHVTPQISRPAFPTFRR